MCAEVALGDFGRHAGVVSRLFKPHTSVARPLRRSAATSVNAQRRSGRGEGHDDDDGCAPTSDGARARPRLLTTAQGVNQGLPL